MGLSCSQDNCEDEFNGFDGFIINQVDIVDKYPEYKTGVYQLIRTISQTYPTLLVVPNNAFEVLPLVYPFIDAIKYEEMCYRYNSELNKYQLRENLDEQKTLLSTLKKQPMPVLALDHIQTRPANNKAALACYKPTQAYNLQGYHFLWNANSVDNDYYMWYFFELK